MIKIRLARYGVIKKPFYRIVAVDSTKKRSGKVLEVIGYWKPSEKLIKIDKTKLSFWTGKGAFVNKSVESLLNKNA